MTKATFGQAARKFRDALEKNDIDAASAALAEYVEDINTDQQFKADHEGEGLISAFGSAVTNYNYFLDADGGNGYELPFKGKGGQYDLPPEFTDAQLALEQLAAKEATATAPQKAYLGAARKLALIPA